MTCSSSIMCLNNKICIYLPTKPIPQIKNRPVFKWDLKPKLNSQFKMAALKYFLTIWNPISNVSEFQMVSIWIFSNHSLAGNSVKGKRLYIWILGMPDSSKQRGSEIWPLQEKLVREVANLTERQNPHTPIYVTSTLYYVTWDWYQRLCVSLL